MLSIEIPGREKIQIENIVFDYNGTLATDGAMSEKTQKKLEQLQNLVDVHILTSDTHGTVRSNCASLKVKIEAFPGENAGSEKERIVEGLGREGTICIGNGYNDFKMAQKCDLFICILGEEGCYGKLLASANVVVTSIDDAFDLLLMPKRLIATLRS
jgi:soluble P-type ATPase